MSPTVTAPSSPPETPGANPKPTMSRTRALVMAIPFVAYPLYLASIGESRWEVWSILVLTLVIALKSQESRTLMLGLYPVGLVALFYDLTRFVQMIGITPDRVHICDLRAHELRLFGLNIGGERFTVQDWTMLHHNVVFDLIFSFPYGTFIFAALFFAIFLYRNDFDGLRRFGWTFFLLNIAAFVTYHVYPAAPPWYFHQHGCTVDLTVHASEAPALARVDSLLGFHYFRGFYARSHNVFGAVPSMHVSYPSLILIEGWRRFGPPMRVSDVLYWLSMCVGAIYLDHHWILDVLIGLGYTLTARLLVGVIFAQLQRRGSGAVSAA